MEMTTFRLNNSASQMFGSQAFPGHSGRAHATICQFNCCKNCM